MRVNLLVERGRTSVHQITLTNFPAIVGRHRSCRLQITSRQVSREHCQFDEQEGMLTVRDLGSSNGTFVNGHRIAIDTVLEPGDRVEIGPVLFQVDYEETEMSTCLSPDMEEDCAHTLCDEIEETDEVMETDEVEEPIDTVESDEKVRIPTPRVATFSSEPDDDCLGFTMIEPLRSEGDSEARERTLFVEEEFRTVSEMFQSPPADDELDGPPTFFDPVEADEPPMTLFENVDDDKKSPS